MDQRSAVLRALALVDQALTADSDQEAADLIRPDLEVLSREDLMWLLMVVTIETSRRWVAPAHRGLLGRRVLAARAELPWRWS